MSMTMAYNLAIARTKRVYACDIDSAGNYVA